jgi:methylaspartate mutase sigma subunit
MYVNNVRLPFDAPHRPDRGPDAPRGRQTPTTGAAAIDTAPTSQSLRMVVAGTASDAHTWNLIYLQLLLEEAGHLVTNFGPCVKDEILLTRCRRTMPDLVVLSTVNGHGRQDGARIIKLLRDAPDLRGVPVVIGGMLGLAGPEGSAAARTLLDAGFDAVFGAHADIGRFLSFVDALSARRGERTAHAAAVLR